MFPPDALRPADYLVVESTYGDRQHAVVDFERVFEDIINATIKRGGIVLVPAFAVGRTQTLLYILHRLRARKAIPDVPIYLENTAGGDHAMARHFDTIAGLWEQIGDTGIGFCLDTCHAWAAGEGCTT
jgi:Cft2 family RNA processing exonuclease